MKITASILAVMAAALLIAPASSQDKINLTRKKAAQESAKKVKELQKEQLAVLKEMAAAATKLFQNGRVEYQEVIDAKVLLFKAELEAADNESERIALYKNMADEWKHFEALAQQKVNAARGTMIPVLRFKAMRLEAEIYLEKAKAKNADVKQPDVGLQKIVVANPQIKDVTITQQYVCQLRAHRHINVRALQTGNIEEVPVKEGQAVKKGDVIFKIAPGLYKARLDIELAEVKLAELELMNIERLFQQKVVAQSEVALYRAKLARAKAKAELAKAELSFTQATAPFDGIIGNLHEQFGGMIKQGESVTTLSDNSLMWAYFNMPEARYLDYMADQDKDRKIELVLANGSKCKHGGKIGAIDARFNNDTYAIPFRADFPNPDGLLRHGMTGNVLIHTAVKDAIVIPQRATFEILDRRYLFVVDKDDVAHRRDIVVKNELKDSYVIHGRVGADEKIVVKGIRQIRDGQKVKYEFRAPK